MLTVLGLACAFTAQGAELARYSFTAGSRASSDTDLNSIASTFNDGPGLIGTVDNGVGNPAPSLRAGASDTTSSQAGALAANDYFFFTIAPGSSFFAGGEIDLTSLTFDRANTGGFTSTFFVRSSVDAFATNLGGTSYTTSSTTFTSATITLTDPSFQDLTVPVEFRFYLYDDTGSGSNRTFIDNVVLNGTAIPEPATYMLLGLGVLICAQQYRRKKS